MQRIRRKGRIRDPNCIRNQRDLEKLYIFDKVFWKLSPKIIPVNTDWTLIQSQIHRKAPSIGEFRDRLFNTFREHSEVTPDTDVASSLLTVCD